MPPPFNCPDCIYKLMLRCWQDDRVLRPTFAEIVQILEEFSHFTDELRKVPKIQELLPINPRSPSRIQLTTTRSFLNQLNLEHYADVFEKCGLGNLSNCFQLEAKDLTYSLNIQSQHDQNKILDEISRISLVYQNSLNTQESYISYNNKLFETNLNHSLISDSVLSDTINQQVQATSIFQLIRTNTSSQKPQFSNTNDLLMLAASPISHNFNQGQTQGLSRGFLV